MHDKVVVIVLSSSSSLLLLLTFLLEWNNVCEQAIQLCTTTRAKKVVVGLTLVALIAQTIDTVCWRQYRIRVINHIYIVVFYVVMPVTVLIINMIVVREVRRRASSDAASTLGLQHQQSTSSSSTVPTVMLVTTSLIYVLLNGTWSISYGAMRLDIVSFQYYKFVHGLSFFLYTYNFYVYLMTGKQFRADLLTLVCCCCRSSSSSSAAAAAVPNADVRVARHGQADTAVWNSTRWSEADVYQRTIRIPWTTCLHYQIIGHVFKLQITECDD